MCQASCDRREVALGSHCSHQSWLRSQVTPASCPVMHCAWQDRVAGTSSVLPASPFLSAQVSLAPEREKVWTALAQIGFKSCTLLDAGLPFPELTRAMEVKLPRQTCWLNIPNVSEQTVLCVSDCYDAGEYS